MNLLYKLLRAYGIFMVCCILLDLIYTKFDIDKNTVVFGIILFFLWAPFNTFFLYLIHFFKIYRKILNKTKNQNGKNTFYLYLINFTIYYKI